jgi:hypothetical protein
VQAPKSKTNPRHAVPLTPPGNHIPALFHQPSRLGHPRHCAALCGEASVSSTTLCYPLSYSPHVAPSKEDGGALEKGTDAYVAPAQDGAAIPATTPPSRALQHHPQRCGSTGRQGATTPAVVQPPTFRQPDHRNDACTTTREEAPTPPPSKPLLDGYKARHDALPEARLARTAVYSTALYTIPPHVAETVQHDCKLHPLGL